MTLKVKGNKLNWQFSTNEISGGILGRLLLQFEWMDDSVLLNGGINGSDHFEFNGSGKKAEENVSATFELSRVGDLLFHRFSL